MNRFLSYLGLSVLFCVGSCSSNSAEGVFDDPRVLPVPEVQVSVTDLTANVRWSISEEIQNVRYTYEFYRGESSTPQESATTRYSSHDFDLVEGENFRIRVRTTAPAGSTEWTDSDFSDFVSFTSEGVDPTPEEPDDDPTVDPGVTFGLPLANENDGVLRAFPGAEGGGMYTTGGRGGEVYHVTNLNDSGPGSFRDAVSKSNRTIVFDVAGTIALASKLKITSSNLTIAGQTAPGDGICIRNYTVELQGDNIIIRYLRFRMGDTTQTEDDALGGRYHSNIVIDHCSMSWCTDECASLYANRNFTMQWCIISESLCNSVHEKGKHGYGGIWGGRNASFHHNLLAHHWSRNPRFDHPYVYDHNNAATIEQYHGNVDFRNNAIYNWGQSENCYGGELCRLNLVNNYYKEGPASKSNKYFFVAYANSCESCAGYGYTYEELMPRIYADGNLYLKRDGSQASSAVTDEYPLNDATPHSLRLDLCSARGEVSAVNTGYWGLAVEAGKRYDLEFYVRSEGTSRCRASIVTSSGKRVASSDVTLSSDGQWHRYTVTMEPDVTGTGNTLQITFPAEGRVWLDYVSLFPEDTFNGRKNGLRKDVAELIAGLHPAFIRWPGGCIVEGLTLENRVKWKETVGDPVTRPGEYNLWGYRSTYGFGYHEFLQFCEDIGSDAMFVCNAGMSCLFRNGDYVQGEALEPLIQDALDAIEYAMAKNGHPEPFPLKYVEVGNENVFWRYAENYNRFHKAIKERYPQITVITALMFSKDIDRLDEVEMIDPHYYETPDWFYNNAGVYDKLSRRTPYKVYVGEYAAVGRSDLYSSLAEAAYLTGVERNSDKVQLVSYAPLLSNSHFNTNHLIVLDNQGSYGRSNYHVMKLFSENRPDYNVPVSIKGEQTSVPYSPEGYVGLATGGTSAEFRDFKVESGGRTVYSTSGFSDFGDRWKAVRGEWSVEDGALCQSSGSGDALAFLDGVDVPDCVISLKARKLDGREGFKVVFGMKDEGHYFMADMGSHTNESVIFREIGDNGSVSLFDYRNQEPVLKDHWYDVRIVISGSVWKCYMDGRLIYTYDHRIVNKHYAVAGIDRDAGELVVKLVNGTATPWETSLVLKGGRPVSDTARKIELTSDEFTDENSFENPLKVSGRESIMETGGSRTPVVCAPRSLTIFRIPVK